MMGAAVQKYPDQVEAVQNILTAVNRPLKGKEISSHPIFQPVMVQPRVLGQIISHMVKRGQLKKVKGAKYEVVAHKEAKAMKIAETMRTLRMEISKSSKTVAFVIEGIRVEVGVVE
jgi:DNA-binding IscR family transcriptional regulator